MPSHAMNGIEREKVGPLSLRSWGLVTGATVWGLYLITLAPTTGFWDTSEYVTTAHILGIPHPPGNPFFVMLGRTWELLLGWTGLGVAARINLLSATLSAGASFFWFLAIAHIVAHFRKNPKEILLTAVICVWIGATSFTVWTQSNLNEKVYTVSFFVVAFLSYIAMVWKEQADTDRGPRLLLLTAFVLGLGWSNHTMSLLPAGAFGLFVLLHRPRTLLRPALLGLCVALLFIGYSPQLLFVPIRSAQNPIIDEADAECPTLLSAVTPARQTDRQGRTRLAVECRALALSLMRDQYGPGPITERQAPLSAQLANYWQYFDWQWARSMGPAPRLLASVLFLFLALYGLLTHFQRDRGTFAYAGTLFFTVTLLLVYYLNFRYGYSIYTEEVPNLTLHEVRERDYFFIIGFQMWGLYAGLGLVTIWRVVAGYFASHARHSFGPGHAKASPILAIALIPLLFNFGGADRSRDTAARDWAYNLLQSVEPYGVLFTNGDNDTFPLWYLQEVEGIRKDVSVIVHSYLGTSWYPKQLRGLTAPCDEGRPATVSRTTIVCQRAYDDSGAGPYEATTPPTRSIISMTDEEIDGMPPGFIIPEARGVRMGDGIVASLAEGTALGHGDLFVLHIIQQAFGDRPIYFAATAGPVYRVWNVGAHLLRQGLAYKLVAGPELDGEGIIDVSVRMGGGGPTWLDWTRTGILLRDTYRLDALAELTEWPEPSTRASIPAQYYLAWFTLGVAELMNENQEASDEAFDRSEFYGRLAGLLEEP